MTTAAIATAIHVFLLLFAATSGPAGVNLKVARTDVEAALVLRLTFSSRRASLVSRQIWIVVAQRTAGSPPESAAAASAVRPAFSASLPSSICARPCTHGVPPVRRPGGAIVPPPRRPARRARRRSCSATARPRRTSAGACRRRSARGRRSGSARRRPRGPARSDVEPDLEPHQPIARIPLAQQSPAASAHRRTASRGCRAGSARSARRSWLSPP